MELLSPAGNVEKLKYAYQYGADAAYIGLHSFSLRAKADNFGKDEAAEIARIKGDKKLFCALNIYFHNQDLDRLDASLDQFEAYPFDAFIISDLGIVRTMQKRFPGRDLHLSTQANALNSDAVKLYRDLGFKRVILGRECSLKDIARIRRDVPDIEIETFVHGAMCLAYSGRCFLSKEMINRSANDGSCAHSCRWDYRPLEGPANTEMVLEEAERPGEYYPIFEGDGFTSILSSKDICMIDYIQDLKDAGVDSLKIEGRMKSIYYTAIVTRAYRKKIDSLEGKSVSNLEGYREELLKVSHREFSTGFYFGKDDIEQPTGKMETSPYQFLGSIGKETAPGEYDLDVKNQILSSQEIEYIGPDLLYQADSGFKLKDPEGNIIEKIDHGKACTIIPGAEVKEGYILRRNIQK
ncbi:MULTISPECIES: U32 family peptidase [unclassified Oceanispirochaeta]|uniref:U32 family peptidase n=1 Tax=unclassified Oceanispirochaeta TaxID=2635722 RepID=UPI000E09002A|nr:MULTISPECIES: U32 family peptidase [unclassified Oceanispirochaeta]MBF9017012.1 U32 family peptidase C-terminal domain-containing protein [Oceanispirochaeta sp. M2]NPD73461.1 U32 family peptidase [Oceanispirochaeta sp. M1]RDG30754.1 U32 family peptidase [Oceanispirochaeta sp. M1]